MNEKTKHYRTFVALRLLTGLFVLLVFHFSSSASHGDDENKVVDISFDNLQFKMEKGDKYDPSMLNEEVLQLESKTVKLRGFVKPGFKKSGITKFIFVRDNQQCCFGPGAALYDCILVRLSKGESIDFTTRPITVEGTLYIKEYMGPDGKVWAIFRMKDAVQR